jgi:hypothetical protein
VAATRDAPRRPGARDDQAQRRLPVLGLVPVHVQGVPGREEPLRPLREPRQRLPPGMRAVSGCLNAGRCFCHCEQYCSPGYHCGNHGNGCHKLCSRFGVPR